LLAFRLSYFHCEEEDFISSLTQGNLEITRLALDAISDLSLEIPYELSSILDMLE
jgi:hypothetical protein